MERKKGFRIAAGVIMITVPSIVISLFALLGFAVLDSSSFMTGDNTHRGLADAVLLIVFIIGLFQIPDIVFGILFTARGKKPFAIVNIVISAIKIFLYGRIIFSDAVHFVSFSFTDVLLIFPLIAHILVIVFSIIYLSAGGKNDDEDILLL